MKLQAFQPGEIRDENNTIISKGAYGKYSPFTNAQNTGILDYIMNNLEILRKSTPQGGRIRFENGTLYVESGGVTYKLQMTRVG